MFSGFIFLLILTTIQANNRTMMFDNNPLPNSIILKWVNYLSVAANSTYNQTMEGIIRIMTVASNHCRRYNQTMEEPCVIREWVKNLVITARKQKMNQSKKTHNITN